MDLDDTIVAVSSPPGAAARGIVRLSGPASIAIAERMFRTSRDQPLSVHTANGYVHGVVAIGPARLPAAAYVFRAPHSYTRQDVVEIHMLGAPSVLGVVVESALATGARRAEPGEFTARAFLGGVLDLSQVHGVAGLVAARSDEQLRAAERLLHGALSEKALAAREELADLLALVEGAMDFADEPIEFITPAVLSDRLSRVGRALESTISAGMRAERWGGLPRVVLLGSPNAGKSSLFNRLTGVDRAICTPMAGTTRDVISAPLALGSMECLLIDMAGLEDAADELSAKAQAAARETINLADLLIHVVDLAAGQVSEIPIADGQPVVCVGNKADLLGSSERNAAARRLSAQAASFWTRVFLPVSAATGEGCDELLRRIEAALLDRPADIHDSAIALMAEHRDALGRALAALDRASELARRCGPQLDSADLVAAELRGSAAALAELVGRDHTEQMLGRIFSRFCVGK
jgi:tRNA modification GTPase